MVRRSSLAAHPFAAFRLERLECRDQPSVSVAATPEDPAEAAIVRGDELAESHSEGLIGRPLLAEPRGRFAVANGPGRAAQVNVYDSQTNAVLGIISPFGGRYTGGARVATGDVTGDSVEDIIVSAGPGGSPWVEVYDGTTLTLATKMLAYAPSFTGGVFVAAGDVTGDGQADIVTGAGEGGGPHIRVFSGADIFPARSNRPAGQPASPVLNFFAYSPHFTGGASVAVADINNDGHADVVTGAGEGGGPHVIVFNGVDGSELESFFAYDPSLRTGVSVAVGPVLGDGKMAIITAPLAGGAPHIRTFVGGTVVGNFYAFDEVSRTGARVAVADMDGDSRPELVVTSGPGAAPKTRVIDGKTGATLRDFPALVPDYNGGLYVG